MNDLQSLEVTSLDELPTPCLLLDQSKMVANIGKMQAHIDSLNASLRPHVKTNKSISVTEKVIENLAVKKITVSTLHEARYFQSHGVNDIMYGVGITPQKLPEVADLMAKGTSISIILDDVSVAQTVCAEGEKRGITFRVHIELDVDGHRSGVLPEDPALIEIGKILQASNGAELVGVMTHAGESYDCPTTDAIVEMAEQERSRSVKAAELLRAAGIECPEVSVGSSPTAAFAQNLDGVTEVRAGVYVFQDLFQSGLGCSTPDQIALSVLGTVNAHKHNKNLIIVDAGWMAMSRDRGTASQKVDQGYGLVVDLDGNPIDDLILVAANQEHGVIGARDGGPVNFDTLPIGSRVRILPNHACATAAQYENYKVHTGKTVTAVWPRIRGW